MTGELYKENEFSRTWYKSSDECILYKVPHGLEEDDFYKIVNEFVQFARLKGLTTRQAQYIFKVCEDAVLDCKLV